jgi:hypothetical protein
LGKYFKNSNRFHRWYGYQNKRDSSSIVHALVFCAKIGLHFNKVQKTSKKTCDFWLVLSIFADFSTLEEF